MTRVVIENKQMTEVFGDLEANFLVQRRPDGLLICIKTEDMAEFRGVLISRERALQLAQEIGRLYGNE